jgi:hypothetical protein
MCELDLTHLQIDLWNFTLNTHLPQRGFESSYRHLKRIHPNRGWRRSRRHAGEGRRHSSPRLGSTKGKSLIGEKWRIWISAVRAGLNKRAKLNGRLPKFFPHFFVAEPELAPFVPPASAHTSRPRKNSRQGWLSGNAQIDSSVSMRLPKRCFM